MNLGQPGTIYETHDFNRAFSLMCQRLCWNKGGGRETRSW